MVWGGLFFFFVFFFPPLALVLFLLLSSPLLSLRIPLAVGKDGAKKALASRGTHLREEREMGEGREVT